MKKDEIQSMAFMIIAYAGSAFDHFYKAIDYARDADFEMCENELSEGRKELNLAHKSQVDLLTSEVNQEDIPFSIIMTHAQDHLTMAIFSERMAKEFICLYKDRWIDKGVEDNVI